MTDRTGAFVETLEAAVRLLLGERAPAGHWTGELSASALSTATAVFALSCDDAGAHASLIRNGLTWLADRANEDGGWGDTTASRSNLSATLLGWSALAAAGAPGAHADTLRRAEAYIRAEAGGTDAASLAAALRRRYGADRTFSAPILTMCALAGRLGEGPGAFRRVAALPFEMAAVPQGLLGRLGLPVVSYALPALIAVGLVRHRRRPPLNPLLRAVRNVTAGRALRILERIQPASGGFLEAAPLSSFVVMGLIGAGEGGHPVVAGAVEFLRNSVRADGSWPIDTNLAVWTTTLAVRSLAGCGLRGYLGDHDRRTIADWLLARQHRRVHPYTSSPPGGWAWTDLPGGVPDADDTAGALLALKDVAAGDPRAPAAAELGVRWLLGLQNRDGGIPTFCRGWGKLPFDRSAADLTAHAVLAWNAWRGRLAQPLGGDIDRATRRAVGYLAGEQEPDGSWTPLWFGNEAAPGRQNPTYGTARVLGALAALGPDRPGLAGMLTRGGEWLLAARNGDGGWGGAPGVASSIEETALAVEALARLAELRPNLPEAEKLRAAALGGAAWLIDRTDAGRSFTPAPIGLYFATLWYFERLYPVIFTVAALRRARELL